MKSLKKLNMIKPKIIAIVGLSGSGKTTASLYLEKELGIEAIVSYTTRPKRESEVDGREHWFVQTGPLDKDSKLAYTKFGGYEYWAEFPENTSICTYTIDEAGLNGLVQRWGDKYDVIPVYIDRPDSDVDEERKKRDLGRTKFSGSYTKIFHNTRTLDLFLQEILEFGKTMLQEETTT